jgi:hypothetical protein
MVGILRGISTKLKASAKRSYFSHLRHLLSLLLKYQMSVSIAELRTKPNARHSHESTVSNRAYLLMLLPSLSNSISGHLHLIQGQKSLVSLSPITAESDNSCIQLLIIGYI